MFVFISQSSTEYNNTKTIKTITIKDMEYWGIVEEDFVLFF